jgi:hypothetical protein
MLPESHESLVVRDREPASACLSVPVPEAAVVCHIRPANRPSSPIKEPRTGVRTTQPRLRRRVFAPTAEFGTVMRINPVSPSLQNQSSRGGGGDDLGRFAAPGRQHFLIPPERRQTFPAGEFT